jgi:type I restriction enzyme S subunit
MSFPRYPKYKDSGVRWLGRTPEHWDVVQSRRLFCVRNEKPLASDKQVTASQQYGILYQEEFVAREGRKVVETIMGTDTLRRVRPNDFVISLRSFQGGLEWSRIEGSITFHYVVLTPLKHVCEPFFAHLFKSIAYIQALRSTTNLIRDGQDLRFSHFVQVDLPIIPFLEQRAIATFLDRETSKIDALIAEQQRLIELLQEKRQAVISDAVTKGLNPDAPMKDTGIEWLGKVPEHWEEFPLGSLMRLKHGYAFDGEGFSDAGEYILMTPGNFHERGGFRSKDPEKYYGGNDFPRDFILEAGQLLVAMTEQAPGLLGSALFVPNEGIYLHNQRVGLVQGLRRDRLCEAFLFYLFNSSRYRAEVSITSTGAKVRHTSPGRMLAVRVWLPPVEEQLVIVAAVDKSLDEIDLLYSASHHSISLLQERRSALISAAVTGQIDVRGLAESEAA